VRPTVAYGPFRESGGSAFLADLIEKPAKGEDVAVDYGNEGFDWHYVKDVSQAFRKATFAPESDLTRQVYNTRGDFASIRDVANVVREQTDGASIEVTDDGTFPFARKPDISAAKRDFGYSPEFDIEKGVKDYIEMIRTSE
jgi:nucleoside-diphosphate-sugar epimerase